MFVLALFAFAASASASASTPAPALTMMETDRPTGLKDGWHVVGDSPRDTTLELVFAVKNTRTGMAALEEELLEVSDPRSARYGQHLTREEMYDLVKPRQAHIDAVHTFLNRFGVTGVEVTPDMITAEVSVAVAEQMLAPAGHKYQEVKHATGPTVHRLRSRGYSLPKEVADAVDLVAPTTFVPTIRTRKVVAKSSSSLSSSSSSSSPDALFNTPKVLRSLYHVGDTDVGKEGKFKQAVTGFLGQTYSEGSLAAFYKYFCGANQSFTCGENGDATKVVCEGDACKGGGGTESMLDIEYINAMGAGVHTEFWGFSGNNPYAKQQEPFMKWLYQAGNTSDADIPKLFSTSYGEDETEIPQAWSERTNAEFVKLGARGVSLLFASGDSGAAGDSGCAGPKNDIFVPQWPSGSPYVTAVGGTSGGSASSPESVAGLSSGGFSNRWKRPKWQTNATATYLKTAAKLPDSTHFNNTGRGFPDIAAQAVNFIIVQFGIPLPGVSGTSCASPTAAGIFGLLNDDRAAAGKSSLGFLNPFIYQNMDAFSDITSGVNNGCGFSTSGFPAAKGWDAATGVGTPRYDKLKTAVLALQ
jgi:tripeptidyl-peptidase-1